jgi:hypothetical protein
MSSEPVAPEAASTGRASSRVRTKVVRLVNASNDTPAKEEWKPPVGKGVAMRDMELCFKYINKMTRNDENLMSLHKIFYGRRGLKATIKPYTLDFAGLVYTEERTRDDVLQKLYSWTMPQVKNVMDNLGINRSSKEGKVDKEGLCDRFCDWLENPTRGINRVAVAKANKKQKKQSKKFKKAMSLDPNRPKKGLSAYMFFAKNKRSSVKEANPDAAVTEIMKLVAVEWNQLSDDDKVQYQTLADEDKKRYENEMINYVPASPPVKVKKAVKKKVAKSKKSTSSSSSVDKKKKKKKKTVTETLEITKKPPPLFPNSRYMMTTNPPKKKVKKRKSSSSKSKRAKKKARMEQEEESPSEEESEEEESEEEESEEEESEEEESEEEESEEEEVQLPVDRKLLDKAIRELLGGADLNTLSIKAIRKQLAEKFSVNLKSVKDEVKNMIMNVVNGN